MKTNKFLLTLLLCFVFCLISSSKVFGYMIPMKVTPSSDNTKTEAYLSIPVAPSDPLDKIARVWQKGDWELKETQYSKDNLYYHYLDYKIEDLKETPAKITGNNERSELTTVNENLEAPVRYGYYDKKNKENDPVFKYSILPSKYPPATYSSPDFTFRFSTSPTTEYKTENPNDDNYVEVCYYPYDKEGNIKNKSGSTMWIKKQKPENSKGDGEGKYFHSQRLDRCDLNITDGKEPAIVTETFRLDSNLCNELINKIAEGNSTIYCSAALTLLYSISGNSEFENRNGYTYWSGIDTLGKWFGIITSDERYANILKISTLNGWSPDGSIANEFDNILKLPDNITNPVKVMVRHIDNKTKQVLPGNKNQTVIGKDGSQSIIDNGWSSLKGSFSKNLSGNNTFSIDGINFSEYYEIKKSESIRIDRLRDYIVYGKSYNLADCKVVTSNTRLNSSNIDKTMKNSSKPGKTNSYTYNSTEGVQYVYVDFYYNINDGTPETPTPKPGIDTKIQDLDSENNPTNCLTVNVPSGESLKPFLETPSYQLRNLRYDLIVSKDSNQVIDYKIGNCSVLKLTSGNLKNGSNSDIGQVIGSSKFTVFNGEPNSSLEIPLTDKAKDKIGNEISSNFSAIENYIKVLPDQNSIQTLGTNTNRDDFYKYYIVPEDRYNGLRSPDIYAEYTEYDVINKTSGKKQVQRSNNKLYINVYTPLSISAKAELTSTIVDHTTTDSKPDFIIQKNAEFTITPSVESTTYSKITIDTSKYLKNYMIILDFDAQVTQNTLDNINSRYKSKYKVGQIIERGNAIEIGLNDKFVAIATSGSGEGDIISQTSNSVKVVGITYNMPSETLLEKVKAEVFTKKTTTSYTYVDNRYIRSVDYNCGSSVTSTKTHSKEDYNNEINMYYDAKYFAIHTLTSRNIGRIYDFKITDCSDIDYKNVFRKTDSGVNDLTGIQYFSGIKKLLIYTNSVNTLDERKDLNIAGTNARTILPLGPYKSTNTSYISAPKLGYRISFDLKTSGYYDYSNANGSQSKRTVKIIPSYYYISKKGDNIIKNIDLYYKNSSEQYVNFNDSNYTIYFKPNDGYRIKYNEFDTPDLATMSTQLEPLNIGNSNGFELTYKMMSISDNNFIQSWYGEFKLPNSTIAIEKGKSINNPLTDGYIGVKFEIICTDVVDNNEITISYNTNDKKAKNKENTTQWDYEGFLGFKNPGDIADNLNLQLEKGNCTINNETYQDIKGTVVLFDIDNRAANDFD